MVEVRHQDKVCYILPMEVMHWPFTLYMVGGEGGCKQFYLSWFQCNILRATSQRGQIDAACIITVSPTWATVGCILQGGLYSPKRVSL